MNLFIISTILLVALFLVLMVIAAEVDFIGYSLIVIMMAYSVKTIQTNVSYKNFRDKSYADYSKDKEYQKWLIDNPRGSKD